MMEFFFVFQTNLFFKVESENRSHLSQETIFAAWNSWSWNKQKHLRLVWFGLVSSYSHSSQNLMTLQESYEFYDHKYVQSHQYNKYVCQFWRFIKARLNKVLSVSSDFKRKVQSSITSSIIGSLFWMDCFPVFPFALL